MRASTAKRSAWRVLCGITLAESAALIWVFGGASTSRLSHYLLSPPGNGLAWTGASLTAIAYIVYAMLGLPFVRRHALSPDTWGEVAGLRAFAVLMALVTGLFEEVFFRKSLMDWVMRTGDGAVLQIAISAVIFGLVHGVWALFGSVRSGIGAVLSTSALGVALGLVYIAGGRSLLPCAAAHIAINLVLEPWLILAATSASWGRRAAIGLG